MIGCDTGPRASNHVYSALSVDIIVQHAESLISTRKRSFGHGLPYNTFSQSPSFGTVFLTAIPTIRSVAKHKYTKFAGDAGPFLNSKAHLCN